MVTKRNKKILVLNLVLCLISLKATAQLNLIPYPNNIQVYDDTLRVKELRVAYSLDLESEFEELQNSMKKWNIAVVKSKSKDANVELKIKNESTEDLGREGYKLNIGNKKILITASMPEGVFYGVQTLIQLIVPGKNNNAAFPFVSIIDKPAFEWRAFMLDESRHFKGKEVVFGLLDQMSKLKMNVFHWHLTDDQGWRIEIKKYPLLTEIGSKRKNTQINGVKSPRRTGIPHSGFYTQEEIKEVIAYADKKHITIIPEIEMPGHASAAIAAYPWLGTLDKPIEVPVTFGILPNIYNVSNDRVHQFIEDVLQEVIELFPGKIIHIGGDEVKYDQWKNNMEIKKYMEKNELKSYVDIQIAFTNNVSNFIETKGYRMMGWNDILGENLHHWNKDVAKEEKNQKLAKNTIIHFWKGSRDLMLSALSKGHDVVNSQHDYTYLDYSLNYLPLEKAYKFNPIPKDIDEKLESQILGLGCQMWGEWIPKTEDLYRQVFPRLAAYSEVGWTQSEHKDFERFQNNLQIVKNNWELTSYLKERTQYPDYVEVTFLVNMNSSPYFEDIEGGKETLTLSGTFNDPNKESKEYGQADSVVLTDYDYDGVYTGTKLVPKNKPLAFVLLKSSNGSWENHTKIIGDVSCGNVGKDNTYEVEIGEKALKISFDAGSCLNISE